MAQPTSEAMEPSLQHRLLRHLAAAERVRESAHLAPHVIARLRRLFGNDEARIRSFLDTPTERLADHSPADIARLHGFDALDHLVDQIEYAAPA